jgi:uncharacterized membrane protein YvbJ
MIAGIHPGIVYCVDCGQENSDQGEFCVRCMHPLLKRDIIHKLAVQQARVLAKSQRTDYVFLSCLSVVMVGTLILILYLFFRGVH